MRINIRRVTGSVVFLLAVASLAVAADDLRLAEAAKSQNMEAVRTLLSEGTPVNVSQPDGVTALHWAVQWDHGEIADLLIDAGAEVNATDNYLAPSAWHACGWVSREPGR